MANQLPRVFFDTNEGYHLILDQSVADLRALGDRLQNGLRVLIYMPGELEMEAHLRFDPNPPLRRLDQPEGAWVADPIEGTLKYLA